LAVCFIYNHVIGGADYNSGPYTITFTAGVTSIPIDVPINDDGTLEVDEDFTLNINSSSLPSGVTPGNPGIATVTISDNDRKLMCIHR